MEMGVVKLEVEWDSKGMVSMISDSEEIRGMLKSFDDHKIKWVRRSTNGLLKIWERISLLGLCTN